MSPPGEIWPQEELAQLGAEKPGEPLSPDGPVRTLCSMLAIPYLNGCPTDNCSSYQVLLLDLQVQGSSVIAKLGPCVAQQAGIVRPATHIFSDAAVIILVMHHRSSLNNA